jgi:ribosomal protein S18 acetylase RimI-like enzyme
MANDSSQIYPARTEADFIYTAQLFSEYAASLSIDLTFQDFATELASIPGKYAPPKGEILLVRMRNEILGCVAMRPLDSEGCCEMKRLYVSPAGRGMGLGKALAEAIIRVGRELGYQEIRLDTLSSMASAIALYKRLGFKDITPYYETPLAGTIFLSLKL